MKTNNHKGTKLSEVSRTRLKRPSVKKCRRLLGKEFEDCTDEQIAELRDRLELLAEITVRTCLKQQQQRSP